MRLTPQDLLVKAINVILSIIIFALGLRFLFRLFGANPEAGFVEFLYNSTSSLLDPFRNIFTPLTVEPGNVIEFSTLIAIFVYSFIGWLFIELIYYISESSPRRRA